MHWSANFQRHIFFHQNQHTYEEFGKSTYDSFLLDIKTGLKRGVIGILDILSGTRLSNKYHKSYVFHIIKFIMFNTIHTIDYDVFLSILIISKWNK